MTRRLTFSERNGIVSAPRQLRTDELTDEIRAKLWALVYAWVDSNARFFGTERYLENEGLTFARLWWVNGLHKPLDEFQTSLTAFVNHVKWRFFAPELNWLFDFLEFCLASEQFPSLHKRALAEVLEVGLAGWRIRDAQIVPVASTEEAEAIASALVELNDTASLGVKTHLRNSASALSGGKWADSARECISAVEAAARGFDEKKTLGEITKTLKPHGKPLHRSLAKSLSSLYGYASDERGIRHSLVDEADAAVAEDEALLLYGLSVSFAQYLVRLRSAADD